MNLAVQQSRAIVSGSRAAPIISVFLLSDQRMPLNGSNTVWNAMVP
jgi:hypothetical protein